jgi:hypothetical protein
MMGGVLGRALAFAGLTAAVWTALAPQMVAQGACAGPTVALVKPFGATLATAMPESCS